MARCFLRKAGTPLAGTKVHPGSITMLSLIQLNLALFVGPPPSSRQRRHPDRFLNCDWLQQQGR